MEEKTVTIYKTKDGKEFRSKSQAEQHERELKNKCYRVTFFVSGEFTTYIHAESEEAAKKWALVNLPYPEEVNMDISSIEVEEDEDY